MRAASELQAVLLACALGACRGEAPAPTANPPRKDPFAEARRLIEQGQADAALAALQSGPGGAQSFLLQGQAWAKKAETAPLPTPAPVGAGAPGGVQGAAALEFKEEELRAISLFEQALAAQGDLAAAHQALADLLAPHALRRLEATAAAGGRSKGRKTRAPEVPPPGPEAGPDASAERVVAEYRLAAQHDSAARAPVEALIAFCERAKRPEDASLGYQELLRRQRESAEPFVRYGDFLSGQKDWEGAVAQYAQALIWKPEDDQTREKVAQLFIAQGEEYLARQQYGAAQQRLRDAQKFVKDKDSPAGRRLQAALAQLGAIRAPAGR